MTFFNRKEDVLDIQITQFGKHLLSKGVFKPVHYAFFDDDILYDGAFGGITEHQNDIKDRIKETPRMKTQYVFHGIETEIKRSIQVQRVRAALDDSLDRNAPQITLPQPEAEKHFATALPLGNSGLGIQNASSWNIKFLKGAFTGSAAIMSSPNTPNVRIPQLNAEILFESTVVGGRGFRGFFEDGTDIEVDEDFIILEVEEENSFRLNKNFDIEIYKIEDQIINGAPTGREILEPLSFPRVSRDFIITENNVFKEKKSERRDLEPFDDTDSTMVEYFFNIEADSEINSFIMCEVKPVEKTKGLFSKRVFNCQDIDNPEADTGLNIYGAEEEYEDPCED